LVWERFGNPANYVEPFFGSGAVLLARPHPPQIETVNDLDGYLCNFWRALQAEPEAVAKWADWPVSECDLLARHKWLIEQKPALERLKSEPDYFDVKIAGWWVWGLCSWIGQGWCVQTANQLPHLGNGGQGINRKLPHLGDGGRGEILSYFTELADRMRRVRIACGDWQRVLGPSVTDRHGTTGIFLDPPYGEGAMEYSAGGNKTNIAQEVADWCAKNGNNPLLKIAFCSYEGAVEMPASWDCVAWKTAGGYGSQANGAGRENSNRERIWFSPSCLSSQISIMDIINQEANFEVAA